MMLLLNKDDEQFDSLEREDTFVEKLEDLRVHFPSDNRIDSSESAVPKFLSLLKELALSHKWKAIIHAMQTLTTNIAVEAEVFNKLTYEVFLQEPTPNIVIFQKLVSQLKTLKDYVQQEVILDYFLFVLSSQQEFDSVFEVKVSNTQGQKSSYTEKKGYFENLYKAYQGLVYYTEWCKLRNRLQDSGHMQQTLQASPRNFTYLQEMADSVIADKKQMEILAERACQCFQVCHSTSGVWDIFVSKEMDMLQYHDRISEAQEVIEEYTTNNNGNPFALKLLYNFYTDNNFDVIKRVEALKMVCQNDKGGSTSLVLFQFYKDLMMDITLTLPLIFTLLDYPQWKDNQEVWDHLVCELKVAHEKNMASAIELEWNCRKEWWIPYHFSCWENTSKTVLPLKAMAAIFLRCGETFIGNVMKCDALHAEEIERISEAKTIVKYTSYSQQASNKT